MAENAHSLKASGRTQTRKPVQTILRTLLLFEKEIASKANYDLVNDSYFMLALRASFIKAFEYSRFCNRIKLGQVDEGAFFLAGALRGVCDELITLSFIHQFQASLRNEVVKILSERAIRNATKEQAKFFKRFRPFQPVLAALEVDQVTNGAETERIDDIARISDLWKPQKGKLSKVEQMADRVRLREIYEYIYRISSDLVHLNPRISLRNGWGKDPLQGKFSTSNFATYYLLFGQIYSIFLFGHYCRAFAQELNLSESFLRNLKPLDEQIGDIDRWPEAVTWEEMNQVGPSQLLRTAMKFAHEQGWDAKLLAEYLPEMEEAARAADLHFS